MDLATLLAKLEALAADWKDRRYVPNCGSDVQFARNEGKEDAFAEASESLIDLIQRAKKGD